MDKYTKVPTPTISQVYDKIRDVKDKVDKILQLLETQQK